jgi:hypothetical protein
LELLNVLVHADVERLKQQIGHDQAERVLLSHLEEFTSFVLKVVLVLSLYFINVFVEQRVQELLAHVADAIPLSLLTVKTNRSGIRHTKLFGDVLLDVGLESSRHFGQLLLHAGIPVVLDGVVGATFKHLGYLSPLIAVVAVHQIEDPFFLSAPADLLDLRVQVVVPALTALLSDPSWEVLSDQSPLLGTVLVDKVKDHAILFLSPGSLDEAWVQNFLPPMEALHICATWKLFGDSFPILSSMFADSFCEMLILHTKLRSLDLI